MYQLLMSGTVWGRFLQVVPMTCVIGIIYAVLRYMHIKKQQLLTVWNIEIAKGLFVCYLIGLINLTLVPSNFWSYIWAHIFIGYSGSEIILFNGEFNLIPSIIKILMGELTIGSWVKTMLVGNLLMFIPFGFFLPIVTNKVYSHNIVKLALAIPVVIEIIQPIVSRSFDIDDIIMNFVGIMIGYFMSAGLKLIVRRQTGDRNAR